MISPDRSKNQRTVRERFMSIGRSSPKKAAIKATDSSREVPKRKHVNVLLSATYMQHRDLGDIVDTLYNRMTSDSWIVVLKALNVFHQLFRGHTRFPQYLSTYTQPINLENFLDVSTQEGVAVSIFIRRYASYMNDKLASYRKFGFDVCDTEDRGKYHTTQMLGADPPALFEHLHVLQEQIDGLFAAVQPRDQVTIQHPKHGQFAIEWVLSSTVIRGNPLMEATIRLLMRDALTLFQHLNTGATKVLGRFFRLPKNSASNALGIHEHFIDECERMDTFLDVCVQAGLKEERGIRLQDAPRKVLPKLKAHLSNYFERTKNTDSSSNVRRKGSSSNIAISADSFQQHATPFVPLPTKARQEPERAVVTPQEQRRTHAMQGNQVKRTDPPKASLKNVSAWGSNTQM